MINKYDESRSFDYENGFVLTSEVYRLGNILAHYELYKKIVNLPGDVVELGVFKGNSFIQFCSFRELLENERSRRIIGFDVFGEFPKTETLRSDSEFISNWNAKFENQFLSVDDLRKSISIKNIGNYELVSGNICQTLPQYVAEHPMLKLSLLHIDTDVYEPTRVGLELLWDRVVPGGILILDDYATVEGETLAVDEFFKNKNVCFAKFPFSHEKPSFIIKGA